MLINVFSSNLQLNEEFRQQVNGYKHSAQKKSSGSLFMEPNFIEAPKSVDWRTKGYVTDVKDQVSVWNCWSTTTSVFFRPHSFWFFAEMTLKGSYLSFTVFISLSLER